MFHSVRHEYLKKPELSFHTFPKNGKSKVIAHTRLGTKELVDRRSVLIRTLKIGKKVSDYLRVCSLHFERSDFLQKGKFVEDYLILAFILIMFILESVKRRTLKSFAVPSQNLPVFEDEEDREAAEALIALLNSHQVEPEDKCDMCQVRETVVCK